MAKKGTKIKRYGSIYEKRSSSVILVLIMIAGLVIFGVAGWLLYTPVHDFIMGLGDSDDTRQGPSVSSSAAPQSQPFEASSRSESHIIEKASKEVKGIYLPVSHVLDHSAFDVALQKAKAADINTVVIDAKDASGTVLYSSSNSVAKSSGVAAARVYDAEKAVEAVKKAGLSPAVRLYTFKDAAAPAADRDMAVHYYDTEIYWLDNSPELGGKMWLNPYSAKAQEYILSMIEELCSAGFEAVLLDSVQFPSGVGLDKAGYGKEAAVKSKSQLLTEFVDKAAEVAEAHGAQLILCTDIYWLAPGAETVNNHLYGGSPHVFFPDTVSVSLPEDSSVWGSRLEMLKDSIQSEMVAFVPAYADDGTLVESSSLIESISSTAANGYILYDPQGNYKFD